VRFIKSLFGFLFSKKFWSFWPALLFACGLAIAWEPFFALFGDPALETDHEIFAGFWVLTALLTVIAMYSITASWRLALGRSLAFSGGVGACGSIIVMMTEGPQLAVIPMVFTLLAFALAYFLIDHIVKPDPLALDKLAEESKHLEGFAGFYRGSLQEWMQAQEERRKKAVQRQWIGLCFAIPAAALVTGASDDFLIPDDDDVWDWAVFFTWAGVMCLGCGFASLPAWELKDDMKERLLKKLCAYFGELKYHKELGRFATAGFQKAGLIAHYNKEEREDGFTGSHGHVAFAMTEVSLEHESGSGKNRIVVSVFNGLMITMDFPLPFKGHTLVRKDLGKLGNWMQEQGTRLERINLNIRQFEDKFEVYSSDQIEARVILTPDIMENLIKLAVLFSGRKYDRLEEKDLLAIARGSVELAFMDNTLMITMATMKNLFEIGNLDAGMEDTARIAQFAREVGLIYEVIDLLELNRKAETFAALKA